MRWEVILVAAIALHFVSQYAFTQNRDGQGSPAAPEPSNLEGRKSWHREEGDDAQIEGEHADPDPQRHSSLAKQSTEDRIAVLEYDLASLREGRMQDALNKVHRTHDLLKRAKSDAGWLYYTGEERARIEKLDAEFQRNMFALAEVQNEEKALQAQLKPLYGIVSYPFFAEQRNTIRNCVATVQELSYNNAWYSGLFNAHRAESLSDLIMQFLVEWLVGYVIMYPFAVAYYALWSAPWSIYAYSSGVTDVVVGAVAWALGVTVMMLPLIALVGGLWLVFVKYGDQIAAAMRERERNRRPQYGGRIG